LFHPLIVTTYSEVDVQLSYRRVAHALPNQRLAALSLEKVAIQQGALAPEVAIQE
jgi:hypothetical protein